VVSVSVIDVTGGTSQNQWERHLGRLCNLLRVRFGVQHVLLSSVPPMHASPALPFPLRWYLGKRAAALNRVMKDLAHSRGDAEFVQPAYPLTKQFIASDGFHPIPRPYAMWAEQLAERIQTR